MWLSDFQHLHLWHSRHQQHTQGLAFISLCLSLSAAHVFSSWESSAFLVTFSLLTFPLSRCGKIFIPLPAAFIFNGTNFVLCFQTTQARLHGGLGCAVVLMAGKQLLGMAGCSRNEQQILAVVPPSVRANLPCQQSQGSAPCGFRKVLVTGHPESSCAALPMEPRRVPAPSAHSLGAGAQGQVLHWEHNGDVCAHPCSSLWRAGAGNNTWGTPETLCDSSMTLLCLQERDHTRPSISTSTGRHQGRDKMQCDGDFSWVFPVLAAAKLETSKSRRAAIPLLRVPWRGGLKVWPKFHFEMVFESTEVLGRGEEERK